MIHWQPSLPDEYRAISKSDLCARIEARRKELAGDVVILGHHYQVDEIVRHADFTGDSFKLSQLAAQRVEEVGAKAVIFCGVHFMAESADILTKDDVSVILPDLSAGCSMADMAQYDDVVDAWEQIHETLEAGGWRGRIIPITYMNSSAAIKAFVGERGGAVCTSSNADRVFEWAMRGGAEKSADPEEDIKLLFLPDQHLGRNTAAAWGLDTDTQTCVYDPKLAQRGDGIGGASAEQLLASSVILWAGHCSVHKLFRPEHCDQIRAQDPDTRILVHPECCKEVVDKSDYRGSTEYIIRMIEDAPEGSRWAVGTEVHLVNRLAQRARQRNVSVRILSDCQCLCTTMYRIDEPHLLWTLDRLAEGEIVNRIQVHPDARRWALVALDRMLELTADQAAAS